jgi:hypothetical protein
MNQLRILAIAALVVACTSQSDQSAHSFRIYKESGVTIAENEGGPRYATDPFEYEFVASLKGDPSVPESLMPRPGDWTAGADANFYVLERRERRVVVFNSAGEYTRTFGRSGRGPGDFVSMRLQSLRDGRLSIFDSSLQRTTVFRLDGTIDEIITLAHGGMKRGLEKTPEGTLVALSSSASHREGITYVALAVTHLSATGRDTLAVIAGNEVATMAEVFIGYTEGKRTVLETALPFGGGATALYVPNRGVMFAEGVTPSLRWYDLRGALVSECRLGIQPQSVSAEMKQEYSESVTVRVATVEPEWVYPEHVAVWNAAMVDDAGFVWLRAVAASIERPDAAGSVMHVVSPDGEYIGVTELPCQVQGFAQGLMLGYNRVEETGERIPVVYHITSAASGLEYP